MEYLIPRDELDTAYWYLDLWFDAAEWVKATGAPVRWYIIYGEDESEHIVLETSQPPLWWCLPGFPAGPHARLVPRFIVEEYAPWLIDAWIQVDALYLSVFVTGAGLGSAVSIDVASTEQNYLAYFMSQRGVIPDTAKARSREEMRAELDLARALQYWDEADDWVLAPSVLKWAEGIMQLLGDRPTAKAKLRWAPTDSA